MGGPERPAAASFPNSESPASASPGRRRSRSKSPQQEAGESPGRGAGRVRGSREGTIPEAPAWPLPALLGSLALGARERTGPGPRVPEGRRAPDPGAPPVAGAGCRSLAPALTCPETEDSASPSATRRPSLARCYLPRSSAPARGTGPGWDGVGPGWGPARAANSARQARAAAAPDSGQGSNSVTEQKAKGPDSQATPLNPSKPRPRG